MELCPHFYPRVHTFIRNTQPAMSRLGNAYLVYNLCRFLRENMARVDKERGLSRFICIFARADICRMGGLSLSWLGQGGHHRGQRTRKERLRCRLHAIQKKTNSMQLQHNHSIILTLWQNILRSKYDRITKKYNLSFKQHNFKSTTQGLAYQKKSWPRMHTTDAELSSFWPKETERLKSAEILTSAKSWYLEMMKLRERNGGQCCGKRKSCRSSRPISENFSYYPQLAMETDKDLDIWKAWLWTLKFAQIEV